MIRFIRQNPRIIAGGLVLLMGVLVFLTQPNRPDIPITPTISPTPSQTPLPPFDVSVLMTPTPTITQTVSPEPVMLASPLSTTPTLPTFTPTMTVVMHYVQQGESLNQIALRYGIPLNVLTNANRLANPNVIFVGQGLVIPDMTAVSQLQTDAPMIAASATESARIVLRVTALYQIAGLRPQDIGVLLPSPTPTPLPPTEVNGMAYEDFIFISPTVEQHIREIYAQGQALGRNPHAFSKIGDSTIENPQFLTRFDQGTYHLGEYTYLQPVIDYYVGSFERQGMAVKRGLHTWSVFDPMWAPKPDCLAGEHMLACEFRLHNPSILFMRMGSNDVGVPDVTHDNFEKIVQFCLENGVIPIMGTKADRFDGADSPNNESIRALAAEYNLPLWDFDLIAETIPGRGLGPDHVHMTGFYAHDWRMPQAFTTGVGVHNLTALIVLDKVWRMIGAGGETK